METTKIIDSPIEEEKIEISTQDLQNILKILRRTESDFLEELALLDFEEKLVETNPNITNFDDTEMSFKEYSKFNALEEKFNADTNGSDLLSSIAKIEASERLQEELLQGFRLGFRTEKERSERLIAHILHEVADKHLENFILHSGRNLKTESFTSLKGECDFVFAKNTVDKYIKSPTCLFIESKAKDMEQGMKQVLAQMFGGMYYNIEQENEIPVIWGVATIGGLWEFVKLEKLPEEDKKDFLITFDKNTFAITKDYDTNKIIGTEKLLGIFDFILKKF